jgi:hypothetical protein
VKNLLLILLPLPFAVACTSSQMRDAGPSDPPGPDESKVIIYRTSIVGSVAPHPVFDGSKLLGFAEKGKYFEVRCEPGKHLFNIGYHHDLWTSYWSVPGEAVDADLAPGKTYYIRLYVGGGLVSTPGPRLAPLRMGTKEWETIEKKLRRLHCRELSLEQAEALGSEAGENVKRIEEGNEELRVDAKRLSREDGR